MATLFLLFLKLSALPPNTHAAPIQNITALQTSIAPSWVPDPNNRGTWSLLYSCIFTLVLCVWTAIHLNVPAHGKPQERQLLRKMKWVLLAIFAPELGAITARQQYWSAKNLCRNLNEKREAHESNKSKDNAESKRVSSILRQLGKC